MTISNERPIYMDYAATTPMDPRVAEKMMQFLTPDGEYGNPASRSHSYGWNAESAVEEARKHVASLVNANPKEIIWTSGATESDNLAIKGVAHFYNSFVRYFSSDKNIHKPLTITLTKSIRIHSYSNLFLNYKTQETAGLYISNSSSVQEESFPFKNAITLF
ncbi:MAG: aminotransferase class V-fold PLP-dependent enzyme [Pseudomonadales bacterium]|nr:aminotransferase class V-fold PLP-dependent enzyme [Pseudomonadales bacterium]